MGLGIFKGRSFGERVIDHAKSKDGARGLYEASERQDDQKFALKEIAKSSRPMMTYEQLRSDFEKVVSSGIVDADSAQEMRNFFAETLEPAASAREVELLFKRRGGDRFDS